MAFLLVDVFLWQRTVAMIWQKTSRIPKRQFRLYIEFVVTDFVTNMRRPRNVKADISEFETVQGSIACRKEGNFFNLSSQENRPQFN
jgi:hypothetical protein